MVELYRTRESMEEQRRTLFLAQAEKDRTLVQTWQNNAEVIVQTRQKKGTTLIQTRQDRVLLQSRQGRKKAPF
jgi:hypothetical protein